MDEMTNAGEPATDEAARPMMELGRWMGRRDAFGQVAGRCSAAEIESLRQIHDGRLYQSLNYTWEEFCSQNLKVSARTVDRELAYLRRFGPAFFVLRQLARISAPEYAAIAGCITEDGVQLNGEVIALNSENSEELAGAVKALLERNPPVEAAPAAAPITFEAAMQRFRAASETLRSFGDQLDRRRAQAVAAEFTKLFTAAAGWGVKLRIE